ncbi:MAG TPA: lytic transglycosylase domain-containing protein, partial [Chloroflexota bacterium]
DQPSGDDQPVDAEAAVDWQAFVPTDTADHLATMDRAARDSGCGVPWQLLAAIARVESDFGRNMATSSAGAIGYGQFLPGSWQAFGSDGNAYDYRDALPAMAVYLCQAGLARDPRVALFAYNHADWYVDLVLDLAVQYDRMAPGAPTPAVLGVGPQDQASTPMHYASGRDVELQARARTAADGVTWLGVPWRGRTPGQPISATALETTTISMLRAAAGLNGKPPPRVGTTDADSLQSLATNAWEADLLPIPERLPRWTLEQLKQHVRLGQPVVALVSSPTLPGHPPGEAPGDQPLVIIGTTPDGLVYSDPTYSSSLGYGLALSDDDFLSVWEASSQPHRALAFVARPRPLARQAHFGEAEPPDPIARVWPSPTPLPLPTATAQPAPEPTSVDLRHQPLVAEAQNASHAEASSLAAVRGDDYSWLAWIVAGTFVLGAFAIRWLRGRSAS